MVPTLKNSVALATFAALLAVESVNASSGRARPLSRTPVTVRDASGHSSRKVDIPVFAPQTLASNDSFDVLEHLAGISPYFNAPGVQLKSDPPSGCKVTRATYLLRHSNIYANDYDYESIIEPFVSKLANFTRTSAPAFLGRNVPTELRFLANWTSPITNASAQVEALTPSGAQSARALGQVLAGLYPDLLPNTTTQRPINGSQGLYNLWASDSERTIATANAFIEGLYPNGGNSSVNLLVVPEGEDESANTLTPHESCPRFEGATGSQQSTAWRDIYTAPITKRFNAVIPSFNFTSGDIFAMQQLCGYETVIRGSSPFCQAFEQDDWLGFEYTNDLMYFYSLGYGSPISPYMGTPWVAASTALLAPDLIPLNSTAGRNSTAQPLNQSVYFSFTHREEPPFVLTALGLFNNSAYDAGLGGDDVNGTMPTDRINYNRAWKTSEILPFLGHVGLERLECGASPATSVSANSTATSYVRALVNAAPIPFPNCQNGPGASCSLTDFVAFVQTLSSIGSPVANSTGVHTYGNFIDACGVNTTRVTNATNLLGIYWGQGPGTNLNGTAAQNGSSVKTSSARRRVALPRLFFW